MHKYLYVCVWHVLVLKWVHVSKQRICESLPFDQQDELMVECNALKELLCYDSKP
jgi:hypothetical protein